MTALAAPGDTFNDVDGHWGQSAIERWSEYGVVNGDGTGGFAPDKQMTRAEFATMLANMLGYKDKAANTFADVNDSDWFADAILKLAAAGVIQGSNGMANPNAPISRQEAAVMMCRAFNIPTTGGNLDFADSADVADWAKGAVAALADRGMMNGVGNNNVAPLADINRASVATLLDNMITEYVTEDKTITGEVSGIVLVAADATVTVENATLNENLIVAPKADGAEVALTGTTTASDVVVGATATVKVDSTASAGTVQMEAANSTVEVAGKADAVVVAESAEGAKASVTETAEVKDVTVAAPNAETQVAGKVETVAVAPTAEGAKANVAETAEVKDVTVAAPKAETQVAGKVETVSVAPTAEGAKANVAANAEVKDMTVAAPNAETQVAGKVENVTVTETAKDVTVNTSSGAQVGNVTTEAEGTTVSGSGKVDSVIATGNADNTNVTTSGTKTENKTESGTMTDGKGNETKPGESGTSSGTTTGGGSSGGTTTQTDSSVVKAFFHDHNNNVADNKLNANYSVSNKVENGVTEVTVSHTNIWKHQNAGSQKGYWTGYAIKAPEGATKVKYVFATAKDGTPANEQSVEVIDAVGTKGLAAYYNYGTSTKYWLGVQWGTPDADSAVTYSETKWFHVTFSASKMPIATNAKVHVVNTYAEVQALSLPGESLNVLLAEGDRNKDTTDPLPEAPWVVVVYDRNVAEALTLKVTQGGTELGDSATSAATIGTKRVQAWAMSPVDGTASLKLWAHSAIGSATFSGTYGVNFSVDGETATAETVTYKHSGENTSTVTFDSQGGSAVVAQTVKSGGKAQKPADPTKTNAYFVGWYNGETAYNFDTSVTTNLTLTAKWVEKTEGTFLTSQKSNADDAVTYATSNSTLTYTVDKAKFAAKNYSTSDTNVYHGDKFYTNIAIEAPTGFNKTNWKVQQSVTAAAATNLATGESSAAVNSSDTNITTDLDVTTNGGKTYIVDWFRIAAPKTGGDRLRFLWQPELRCDL